jgi:hypothetical protein
MGIYAIDRLAATARREFGLGRRLLVDGATPEVIDSNADGKTTEVYARYAPDATNQAAFVERAFVT